MLWLGHVLYRHFSQHKRSAICFNCIGGNADCWQLQNQETLAKTRFRCYRKPPKNVMHVLKKGFTVMVKLYGHNEDHCFLLHLCIKYWQNKRSCGLEIFKWAVLGACFWMVLLKSLCHMQNRPRCPLQAACWAPTLCGRLRGSWGGFCQASTAAKQISWFCFIYFFLS